MRNEGWSRQIKSDAETGDWAIPEHTLCFGDLNVWAISRAEPKE